MWQSPKKGNVREYEYDQYNGNRVECASCWRFGTGFITSKKRSAVTVVDSGLYDTFASWCHYDLLIWSKIFKSGTPDVTPSGPFCCAAHRAATRLAPLTRAAATDASGLRPPRSAWQPLPQLPFISPSASYPDSSPALSVDCAAQRGAGRDGAVSPVTGR